MLMNYHELTMNEPRDSAERRKQFLVICTVMIAAFIHSVVQAGCLLPIDIEEGTFPGGQFIYKKTQRDYGASGSLEEFIGKRDLGMKPGEFVDKIYTIYLDDPLTTNGHQQRFASGFLIRNNDVEDKGETLLSKNDMRAPPTKEESLDLRVLELWPKLEYKTAILPRVMSATVQFPHSGGFLSAIVFSMKVIPALRKYAESHYSDNASKGPVTVISTCCRTDRVCKLHAPLLQGEQFLLEDPQSEYMQSLEKVIPSDLRSKAADSCT